MLSYHIFPVTPFAQNCHILVCEETKKAAIVDPGGEAEKLTAEIEKLGCELESIFVTHGHADHAGGVQSMKDKFKVPIIGPHKEDHFWIEMIPQQAATFGLQGAQSFTPDKWLEDGDIVKVGNQKLSVIHCPGHTPGHLVFYSEKANFASVGDVIFAGSIGRTDFPRGNHQQLIDSIREKLFQLPDNTLFVPGHGPTSTFGEEKVSNPFVANSLFG